MAELEEAAGTAQGPRILNAPDLIHASTRSIEMTLQMNQGTRTFVLGTQFFVGYQGEREKRPVVHVPTLQSSHLLYALPPEKPPTLRPEKSMTSGTYALPFYLLPDIQEGGPIYPIPIGIQYDWQPLTQEPHGSLGTYTLRAVGCFLPLPQDPLLLRPLSHWTVRRRRIRPSAILRTEFYSAGTEFKRDNTETETIRMAVANILEELPPSTLYASTQLLDYLLQ